MLEPYHHRVAMLSGFSFDNLLEKGQDVIAVMLNHLNGNIDINFLILI